MYLIVSYVNINLCFFFLKTVGYGSVAENVSHSNNIIVTNGADRCIIPVLNTERVLAKFQQSCSAY